MKPKTITRRDFLRMSGLSIAGLVAGGGVVSFLSSCAATDQALATSTPTRR